MQIEKNEKGCIKILNTSGIDMKTWTKFLIAINHLGYAIPDENDLRDYFDRKCFLQEDQSREVLRILNGKSKKPMFSEKKIKSDNEKAKKAFGVTECCNLAGYLLTDGDMLMFSYDGYERDIDHREISDVIHPKGNGYSDGLIQFVCYGNIRLNNYGFELSKRPTSAQIKRLGEFIQVKNEIGFYVDIANDNGQVIKSFEYDIPRLSEILKDINHYFDVLEN